MYVSAGGREAWSCGLHSYIVGEGRGRVKMSSG